MSRSWRQILTRDLTQRGSDLRDESKVLNGIHSFLRVTHQMHTFFLSFLAINYVSGIDYNYLKYREFNSVPKGLEDSVDESVAGTKLFVKWNDWSCCSACCCPQAVCKKFATSRNCGSVQSVRHRRGNFTLVRLRDTGNQQLEQLFNENHEVRLEKAMQIGSIGAALDSSRASLAKKMRVSADTLSVFQIEDCDKHVQKTDCWALAQCLFGSSQMLPEKEVALVEESDVCENSTIIVIREAYNILSLEPEKLYRLQIDSSVGGGSFIAANFTFLKKKVEKLKHVKDCAHQPKRVFQHPNGKDLIVRLSDEQLSKNPKIIAVISYQSSPQLRIVIDIVSKTKKKQEIAAQKEEWLSIVLISFLAASTVVLLGLSLFFLR